MRITQTELRGVVVLEPARYRDHRGWFSESWHNQRYGDLQIGPFVQDNISHSRLGVVRGLHFQRRQPQGKLVMAVRGAIFDVAVDLRRSSSTYGKWVGVELTEDNGKQLWIADGFAHGFSVRSDSATVLYKCTGYYAPDDQHGIRWDDPALAIPWQVEKPELSEQDGRWPNLADLPANIAFE